MHYKNGREAKVGDRIITQDWNGLPIAGIVIKTQATAETCNLTVAPTREVFTATAKECLHVDDAMSVSAPEAEQADPKETASEAA